MFKTVFMFCAWAWFLTITTWLLAENTAGKDEVNYWMKRATAPLAIGWFAWRSLSLRPTKPQPRQEC